MECLLCSAVLDEHLVPELVVVAAFVQMKKDIRSKQVPMNPQSAKRGIVKCLYDRAKHLTSKPSAISEEKKHLSSVLVSNGYPSSFVRKLTKTTRPTANKEPTRECKSAAVLSYIEGVNK